MKLSELIRQDTFTSSAQEVILNVIVTGSWLLSELMTAMAPYGVTPAQYNVLRILRGSDPNKMTCSAIGARLLDRTPDVTRLLNRLERSGFIDRERASYDRRVVEVGITEAGLVLLNKMQEHVNTMQDQLTCHLAEGERHQLIEYLESLRADQVV